MPESVKDRPTRSHETVFLLTKSQRYFWDAEAVSEKSIYGEHHERYQGTYIRHKIEAMQESGATNGEQFQEGLRRAAVNPARRNVRSVWAIGTSSFADAHFATFPEKLVEPMVLAGTSERGQCPTCGSPWVREVETTTIGWRQSCACPAHEPVPQLVLDPFAGAATTGVVARRFGRRFVGVELNAAYVKMARRRLAETQPQLGMFGIEMDLPVGVTYTESDVPEDVLLGRKKRHD
jgi:hypothetical protein